MFSKARKYKSLKHDYAPPWWDKLVAYAIIILITPISIFLNLILGLNCVVFIALAFYGIFYLIGVSNETIKFVVILAVLFALDVYHDKVVRLKLIIMTMSLVTTSSIVIFLIIDNLF